MKPLRPVFPLALIVLILTASCSPSPDRGAPALEKASPKLALDLSRNEGASQAPSPGEAVPYVDRKQVKTGSATLETDDLDGAEKALADRVAALGGFVENTRSQPRYRTLVLRIPAGSFDTFLSGLSTWGRVTARQVEVADVTVQYYDLETRLKNQRLLLDQYRLLLSKTGRLADTLEVMEKITALTTEIESSEGQLRYLSRQVDLSTLTVDLTLPLAQGGRDWPDWAAGFSDLVHTLADFGAGTVLFLLGALVIGPVAVALLFLAVWLWAGKPGLGRRLGALVPPGTRRPRGRSRR